MKSVERQLYSAESLNGYRDRIKGLETTNSPEKAVLRSSLITRSFIGGVKALLIQEEKENLHAPALDIDGINCEVRPSSTEGNFHLYIDKPMSWDDYTKLMKVMYEVGILEKGFYEMSVEAGMSFLRVRDRKHDPK